jgi:aminoglycoside phosphotransferase family enzyme
VSSQSPEIVTGRWNSVAQVSWTGVIEMTRFDQDDLFDRLAARGHLDLGLMRLLASAIAQFHLNAGRRADHGGRSGMAWVLQHVTSLLRRLIDGRLTPPLSDLRAPAQGLKGPFNTVRL